MKTFWILTTFLLMMLINTHNATAFSTESGASPNSGVSSNFSDPDEQMPGFVVGPTSASTRSNPLSDTSPSVTLPTVGENDSGARAFNEAFSHQQDK